MLDHGGRTLAELRRLQPQSAGSENGGLVRKAPSGPSEAASAAVWKPPQEMLVMPLP